MFDLRKIATALSRFHGKRPDEEDGTGEPFSPPHPKSPVDYSKYAAVLAQFSPDIIYQLDSQGNIVFISQAVRKLGWDPADLVGKPFSDIVHEDYRRKAYDRYCERRTGERATQDLELRLQARKGENRDFEMKHAPVDLSARGIWNVSDQEIKRADKAFLGTIGIARDVTDRLRAEAQLQQAHDELERRVKERTAELRAANQALQADIAARKRAEDEQKRLQAQLLESEKMGAVGRLAGGVAHDFNNRLTVISGYGELLLSELEDGSPASADVAQIMKAADSAAALTRQLLLFSRRSEGEPSVLDPNKLLESCQGMLHRLLGEDVELVVRPAPDICRIHADRSQIEQVIINLAINARDALQGGGRISIDTATEVLDAKTYLHLSVEDSGSGIDSKHLPHLFEPFFTTKEHGKGTGLGLSVVYGIVKQHGGRITVDSELGKGSTFHVYVPATTARTQPPPQKSAPEALKEPTGERILYVEDEEDVRRMSARALRTRGYDVVDVRTGAEAIDAYDDQGPFDLLLSDVVLPDANGLDLAARLARQGSLRVLLTSGYTDERAGRKRIREYGYPFLEKPYDVNVLLDTVRSTLKADPATGQ
jgi:PAS domain S-box-containing protein